MKIAKYFLVTLFLISIATFTSKYLLDKSLVAGEDHKNLRNNIAQDEIVVLKSALEKFKLKNNHYPITSSKYFLDSLINFLEIKQSLLYQDSVVDGRVIKTHNDIKFITSHKNLYVGIGNKNSIIKYCYEQPTF